MGEWVVLFAVVVVLLLLVAAAGRRSNRDGGSMAGHYDPNAIGDYTLDPATMRYRYELPTMPPTGSPAAPVSGPPHRRRRRHRDPDAEGG